MEFIFMKLAILIKQNKLYSESLAMDRLSTFRFINSDNGTTDIQSDQFLCNLH